MPAIFKTSALALVYLSLASIGQAIAFEPLAGAPWTGKAMIVRTTCQPAKAITNDPSQRFILTSTGGKSQIKAYRSATPRILAGREFRLTKVAAGYRLTDTAGLALAHRDGQLSLERASADCAQILRFDQFPMNAPARRFILVGEADHPSFAGARRFVDFDTAIRAARPGDLLLLTRGRYRGPLRVPREISGAPNGWITIAAAEPFGAHIYADTEHASLSIDGARYIEVRGVSVSNQGIGDCIGARGSAHIRIISTMTRDCGGGGISIMQSDHVRIEGNLALRNSFISPWQNSGISIYQPQASDSAPGWHNIIINNVSAFNDNRSPPPGQRFATDGNGIIVDDGRNTQYGSRAGPFRFPILVENNIVFGNGGSGVRVFATDAVTVRRNTSFHNDHTNSPRQEERSELAALDCDDCRFESNIAVSGPWASRPAGMFAYGDARRAVWIANVFASAQAGGRAELRYARATPRPNMSDNIFDVSPQFAGARLSLDANFSLTGPPSLQALNVGADPALVPPLDPGS